MTRLFFALLTLLFLNGPAMGENSDFRRCYLPQRGATNPLRLDFKFASDFTAPAKRATGETVLGHHPAYSPLADATGTRYYNTPSGVWDTLSADEAWAANVKFLDRTISRGDSIRLATPLD